MLDPKIRIEKVLSAWGNVTWNAYVDGHLVINCRHKRDAIEVANARLANEEERFQSLSQEIENEFEV